MSKCGIFSCVLTLTSGISSASANPNFYAGLQEFERGEWRSAISLLRAEFPVQPNVPLTTREDQALRYSAQAHWQLGHADAAIQHLETLGSHYRQFSRPLELGRIKTQKAQYLIELGNFNQGRRLLCGDRASALEDCSPDSSIGLARTAGDSSGQVAALGSFGHLLNQTGEFDFAQDALQAALTLSAKSDQSPYQIQLLSSLGQTYYRRASRAENYAQLSERSNDRIRAQVFEQRQQIALQRSVELFEQAYQHLQNQPVSSLHIATATQLTQAYQAQATDQEAKVERLLSEAQAWLDQLPLSQTKLFAAARVAQLRMAPQPLALARDNVTASRCSPSQATHPEILIQQVTDVIKMAQDLGIREVEAYSLGLLGEAARCNNQLQLAQRYTEQAISGSKQAENRYRWEWQLGQIFQTQGQIQKALNAYEQAAFTLDQVRGDVVAANRDFQLDLQANVERLYRDLSYLQLQQISRLPNPSLSPLTPKALQNLDKLRLVELQNYLADDCEIPQVEAAVQEIDPNTAVIRTILFSERMAVALTYRDRNNQPRTTLHWVDQSKSAITQTVNQFRFNLEKRSDLTQRYLAEAQTLYRWLIQPIQSELEQQHIETLVFIHDGLLRSVPMASLHNGTAFLVESFTIANATHWLPAQPQQPFESDRMIAFGLTQPAEVVQFSRPFSFSPLPGVRRELTAIESQLKGSQTFLNQAFSPQVVQQTLEENTPQTLHLATHARFGIDPRETFLITGTKDPAGEGNQTIRMPELYQLIRSLRSPIALLALTGCETAAGNDRDALGLTGIALQAGVDTVMASLWQLDDQVTGQIVPKFYQHLSEGIPTAQALRQAQLDWIQEQQDGRFGHPGYWAALMIVGDWR